MIPVVSFSFVMVHLGWKFWVTLSHSDGSFEAPGIIATVFSAVRAEMAHSFCKVNLTFE